MTKGKRTELTAITKQGAVMTRKTNQAGTNENHKKASRWV